jgi:hypothetical protein
MRFPEAFFINMVIFIKPLENLFSPGCRLNKAFSGKREDYLLSWYEDIIKK